ncbi:hypothetical protein ACIGMX_34640 [Streptomyces aquilus]|uniref:hypothetical protein n=1 Tax=Streptomyces aquilus TaxID=2548456 RepID=UPI0037D21B97
MTNFKAGDAVTVTAPVQPTAHHGGETGVVTAAANEHGVIGFQQDSDGQIVGVYTDEISHS